ncbi:hypothetical protein FGB62_124g021 [Gracilaria domingensis]|nr:hypothetical protein FGB62_124g021 [Gracilaria domingensis]
MVSFLCLPQDFLSKQIDASSVKTLKSQYRLLDFFHRQSLNDSEIATDGKLNFEPCFSTSECAGDRFCLSFTDEGVPEECTGQDDCFCGPLEPPICTSDDDCDEGERCVELPGIDFNSLCVSNEIESATDAGLEEPSSPGSGNAISTSTGDKLNFEPCFSASECAGNRFCLGFTDEGFVDLCTVQDDCFCGPLEPPICTFDDDCEEGERCVEPAGIDINLLCVSNEIESATDAGPEEPSSPGNDNTISTSTGDKLNFETCSTTSECAGDRICLVFVDEGVSECAGEGECFCASLEPPICTSDNDCDVGERCDVHPELFSGEVCVANKVQFGSDSDPVPTPTSTGPPETPSGEISSTPSIDDECESNGDCGPNRICVEIDGTARCLMEVENTDVCISSHHLTALSPEEVMYPKNRLARVLCDENNSCATPGHIVKYEDKPMMMRRYCELVECSEKVHQVNSPRYVRGKLLKSNSGGLMFTALAARYGSGLEEAVLAFALRFGV